MAQIKLDSNNIVIAWCTVGGIEGGISVDNVPDYVQSAPVGFYKYVKGKFTVNPDYAETAETEPAQEEINLDMDFRITCLELGL